MFRNLIAIILSAVSLLAFPVSAQTFSFVETQATWMCRYVISASASYIECVDPNYDEALTDEPQAVRRLQVYSLPASEQDVQLAEQLVDAVLCVNVPNCTAYLNPPRWG